MKIKNPKRIECRVLALIILSIIYYNFKTLEICLILSVFFYFFPILILPLTRLTHLVFRFLSGKLVNSFIFLSFWIIIFPYSLILYPLKLFKLKKKFLDKDDWKENNFMDELK